MRQDIDLTLQVTRSHAARQSQALPRRSPGIEQQSVHLLTEFSTISANRPFPTSGPHNPSPHSPCERLGSAQRAPRGALRRQGKEGGNSGTLHPSRRNPRYSSGEQLQPRVWTSSTCWCAHQCEDDSVPGLGTDRDPSRGGARRTPRSAVRAHWRSGSNILGSVGRSPKFRSEKGL